MFTMLIEIGLLMILTCCEAQDDTVSYCHLDYCKTEDFLVSTPAAPALGSQCTVTQVKETKDCDKLHFDSAYYQSPLNNRTKFNLLAFVGDSKKGSERSIAFNLSITDISFLRLIVRHQDITNKEKSSSCRQLNFSSNEINPLPKNVLLSCLFFGELVEGRSYRIEYLVIEKHWEYAKRHVFTVPYSNLLDENNVTTYLPFDYVDASNSLNLSLYIQPLPPKYNITKYRIWLNSNDTRVRRDVIVSSSSDDEQLIRYNFPVQKGTYNFKVAALHANCSEYGCVNATTPLITIREASRRLLIMIISFIWIPPVILYALYHIFKLYKKKEVIGKKVWNENCLLVYSPTCEVHAKVMAEFALYLESCNINAVIDICNTPENMMKDVEYWCKTAFFNANIILIATSPSPNEPIIRNIHEETSDRILRLIKENYPSKNKTYYIIEFPYCKPDDVPEGIQNFKRFHMPDELAKLVKAIRNDNCVKFIDVSDKKLLDNIKLAQTEIMEDRISEVKVADETDGLLPLAIANDCTLNTMERSRGLRSIDKNVNEAYLLVESLEGKKEFANALRNPTSDKN